MSSEHTTFLREAIALSQQAVAHGNHPFGAVLVRDGRILLRAENTVNTEHNPTGHAESNLVRLAAVRYEPEFLRGCVLYTSTEPCIMCAGAIYWANIGTVVFACSEGRLGEIAGHVSIKITSREVFARGQAYQVEVLGPLIEEEAADVHLAFWRV